MLYLAGITIVKVFAFIFFIDSFANDGTATLRGVVKDKDIDKFIEHAEIRIYNDFVDEVVKTDNNGEYEITWNYTQTDGEPESSVPELFTLSSNYPNPFNPTTRVDINTPEADQFQISLYDILGRRIVSTTESLDAGTSIVEFSGLGAVGTYVLRVSGADHSETITMTNILGSSADSPDITLVAAGGTAVASQTRTKQIQPVEFEESELEVTLTASHYPSVDTTITISEDQTEFEIDFMVEALETDPPALMLTWQQDPATTMTIDWHVFSNNDRRDTTLYYKPVGDTDWKRAGSETLDFPFTTREIQRVELTGLESDTYYRFRTGEYGKRYKFRTMPATLEDNSVTFAAGGDVHHERRLMEATNRQVMKYDPDFITWGGDLAYADGDEDKGHLWISFFQGIKSTLISEEGRVVPIIAGIGNHEVQNMFTYRNDSYLHWDQFRLRYAPYFFRLFAFPGLPGFDVLDFGDYMSLIILDSMHANDPEYQYEWLDETLNARREVNHVFPNYHVAGWSSVKGIKYRDEQYQVQEYFHTLFDKYELPVVFENHDHAYKRTPPMRGKEVVADGEGTVYLGDGAWGVSVRDMVYHIPEEHIEKYDFEVEDDKEDMQYGTSRQVVQYSHTFDAYITRARDLPDGYDYEMDIDDIPYLEEFASVRHGIIVDIEIDRADFTVVTEDGDIIDTYSYELSQ